MSSILSKFSLDNKIALVTGASKGIGYGVAKQMAAAGATIICAARDVAALDVLKSEIETAGGKADVMPLDVTDMAAIQSTLDEIVKKHGRLDILVNNAGLGFNHPATDVNMKDWDAMMDVNLKGAFFCAQAAGKIMLKQKYGRIINMSSQASTVAIENHAVYCATKGGINQLTRVLALEWADQGVTVNAVAPTFTYTPGTAERLDNPEFLASVLDRLPVKRVATIDDVACAIIYLASDASSMLTGVILPVDGGWTIQ